MSTIIITTKTPVLCPVCGAGNSHCRGCDGTGIVYQIEERTETPEPDTEPVIPPSAPPYTPQPTPWTYPVPFGPDPLYPWYYYPTTEKFYELRNNPNSGECGDCCK